LTAVLCSVRLPRKRRASPPEMTISSRYGVGCGLLPIYIRILLDYSDDEVTGSADLEGEGVLG